MKAKRRKKGKYFTGFTTLLTFLEEAAQNKEIYQSGLESKLEVSYRTVVRSLHELEGFGWLSLIRREPSEKKGKEKNVWAITLKGLFQYIGYNLDKGVNEKLDLIAEVHNDKLLTFKKWAFFQQEGLNVAVKKTFVKSFEALAYLELYEGDLYLGKIVSQTEKDFQEMFDSMILGCYALRNFKLEELKNNKETVSFLKILSACKKDQELHRFVLNKLQYFQKRSKEEASRIRKGLQFMKT